MLTTALQMLLFTTVTADDALEPKRMENMLKNGDDRWIIQTFRRHPSETLPFIDQYLEGGLKIIEDGGGSDKAHESMRKGLQFAELADQAFGEEIFGNYAAAFGSWSPQEQKDFRKGQANFKQASKTEDPAAAIELLEESFALANVLQDAWGVAMYQTGIAQNLLKQGKHQEAAQVAKQAVNLNGRLRLRTGFVRSNVIVGKALSVTGPYKEAAEHLAAAWNTLVDDDPMTLRDDVREAYIAVLEKTGDTAAAAKLRESKEMDNKDG